MLGEKLYKQLNKTIRLLRHKGKEPYLSLSKILGFYPNDIRIYEQALLHKSSSISTDDGRWVNNERLEFLGDGILDAVVADYVYKRYPNKREGFMTNARSKIVQREMMNKIALELGLDRLVIYATKTTTHNNYMYGNALEALIGAIYLDQGYERCYKFVSEVMIGRHINVDKLAFKEINFKSSLIEWSQKHKIPVQFDLIESFNDNDGNPVFQTAIGIFGEQIGIGIGYTKKESQQAASKMAIKKLRTDKELQRRINEEKRRLRREARERAEAARETAIEAMPSTEADNETNDN